MESWGDFFYLFDAYIIYVNPINGRSDSIRSFLPTPNIITNCDHEVECIEEDVYSWKINSQT